VGADFGCAAAHLWCSVAEARAQLVVAERAEAVQRTQCSAAHGGRFVVEAGAGRIGIAHVPGKRDDAAAIGDGLQGRAGAHDQLFSKLDKVVTAQEIANAVTMAMMAPVSTVRKLVADRAQTRRQIGVRR